jgi:CAAX protease family protein
VPVAAVLFVIYGNVKAYVALVVLDGSPVAAALFGVAAGIGAAALALVCARRAGLERSELGLDPRARRQALAIGLGVGLTVALLSALALVVLPLVAGDAADLATSSPAARAAWDALLVRVVALLWFDTALAEEVVFRGLILGLALRTAPRPTTAPRSGRGLGVFVDIVRGMWSRPVLIAAIPFALWHVVVVWQDDPGAPWPVMVGKLAVIFAGGLYFGSVRLRAGHLIGSIIAHWSFDACAMIAVRVAVSAAGGA